MTVVMHDPLYPTRLPSLYETLDFTVEETNPDELTASLLLPDGGIEGIFQAGLINTRDYVVTRDGAESRTFHVQRKAGWPEGDFKIPILEAAAEHVPGPSAWGEIYSVDFTSLPTQSPITTAGAYTIDGLTWYAKGALTGLPFGVVMSSALVNGSGLCIAANGAIGLNNGLTYAGRWFGIPISAFPNLAPDVPFIVRARFTSTDFGNNTGWIGFVDSTNDGAALLQAQRSRDFLAGNWRTLAVNSNIYTKVANNVENNLGSNAPALPADSIYGVVAISSTQTLPLKQVAVGAGIVSSVSTVQYPITGMVTPGGTYTNKMIAFMYSSNGPNTLYMTHFAIHQPVST